MSASDGEISGFLERANDRSIIKGSHGWYRTDDPEKAARIAENNWIKTVRKNPIKGRGKFEGETYAAKFAYDYPDDEIGSVDELGWYGKFSGKIKGRGPFHIIVNENSDGFVSGTFYDTPSQLKRAWARIEKEYENLADENDGENYE
jgi:hypothetical protein